VRTRRTRVLRTKGAFLVARVGPSCSSCFSVDRALVLRLESHEPILPDCPSARAVVMRVLLLVDDLTIIVLDEGFLQLVHVDVVVGVNPCHHLAFDLASGAGWNSEPVTPVLDWLADPVTDENERCEAVRLEHLAECLFGLVVDRSFLVVAHR